MKLIDTLKKEATYALNSKSRDLVFEVYGKAKMACELKAITFEEFSIINDMLIVNAVNNRRNVKLF